MGTGGLVTRGDGSTYQISTCLYPSYGTTPHAPLAAPLVDTGYTGWVEWAVDTLPRPNWFSKLTARWQVPAAPVGSYPSGQIRTYYAFPALHEAYIVQPVLQYGYNGDFGGSYWTVASWICNPYRNPHCSHSTPMNAGVGDTIYGRVVASSCSKGQCTYTVSSKVNQRDSSTYSEEAIHNDLAADGGVVEVWNFTSCDQYPLVGVFFKDVSLYDSGGYRLQPGSVHWIDSIAPGVTPSCQFNVTTNGFDIVRLWHNVPPLSVTISGPSRVRPNYACTWWANPTGGAPPISYSWIPGGAQTSAVTMSWSSSGRLTVYVTDSVGQQASAYKDIAVSQSAPICQSRPVGP